MSLGNVFVLGDSYSTFEGYIPEGFNSYYSNAGREETDVTDVSETWWHMLIEEMGGKLALNSSYSGSTICNTGYDGRDCSDISFIARLDALIADGFFDKNRIDTFIIFGGTNDTWSNAPLGERKYADWSREDLYSVLPAIGYLFDRVAKVLPDAKIVCIVNTELKSEIEAELVFAGEKHGAEVVMLRDIDKNFGHPTIKGMREIMEQVEKKLMK